jgi:hypothetical protein
MASPGFLSKRVIRKSQTDLTEDRYEYLGLNQAEPDLGDPLVGPSSIASKPKPISGDVYVLAAYSTRSTSGVNTNRYWVNSADLPQGLVPGSFTVFNNDIQVGTANSFNKFNFVGTGVTVDFVGPGAEEQTGIATVRISVVDAVAKGNIKDIQYHGLNGLIEGANNFVFDPATGYVGIGSLIPSQPLDVSGNVNLNGLVVLPNTTQSTSKDTGALIIEGGVGVERNLNVGGTLNITGISTLTNLRVSNNTNTDTLSINGTQIVSSTRQLQNIASLDGTTIATIENAIANAPNNFVDLQVSGISTFTNGPIIIGSGTSTGPKLQVEGDVSIASTVGIGTVINIIPYDTLNSGTLSFEGSAGQLLSISNNSSNGTILSVGSIPSIDVDADGTILFGPYGGNVGVGTTDPTQRLHINGNLRLTGTIYDELNNGGTPGNFLVKSANGGLVWQDSTSVSAGGTFNSVQFNGNGILTGEETFVYDSINSRVGIGTSIPQSTLNVVGDTTIDGNLNVTGISTLNFGVAGVINFGNVYLVGTGVTVVTGTATTSISSLDVSSFRSIKYQVQISQNEDFQATDILVIHNGTTSNLIEYGSIATNDYLGTFDTSIDGGNLNLNLSLNVGLAATVTIAYHGLKIV